MTQDQNGAYYIDAGAVMLWIASMANFLPAVAAVLSAIWMILRILETKTVQQMLGKYRWIKENNRNGDEI